MKTPSRVTARLASPAASKPPPGDSEKNRVSPQCCRDVMRNSRYALTRFAIAQYVGQATARKRSPAQPYILTIVGDARSIAAHRCEHGSIVVWGAAQGFQRSPHNFLNMLVTLWIAECRRARGTIAFTSSFLAAKLGKKIAAG